MPNAFFGLQVPSSNSLAVARVLLAISGRPEAHIDHKPPKASILGTWKAKLPWMPRHTPMALAGLDDSQNWPGAGEEGKDKNGSCWGNPRGVVVECWFLPRGPCMDWFGRVFVANHAVFWVFWLFFVPDSAGHATSSVFLLEPKEPAPAKQKRGSTSEKAGACD